jgi:hypothetical protein
MSTLMALNPVLYAFLLLISRRRRIYLLPTVVTPAHVLAIWPQNPDLQGNPRITRGMTEVPVILLYCDRSLGLWATWQYNPCNFTLPHLAPFHPK